MGSDLEDCIARVGFELWLPHLESGALSNELTGATTLDKL